MVFVELEKLQWKVWW